MNNGADHLLLFIAVFLPIAILVAIPCFYVTKKLVCDILIIIKGNRYKGICINKSGLKNTVHHVEWTDSAGIKNAALFSIVSFRKPPYSVKVYSIDGETGKANLGIRSILYYIPVVILFDMTLLLLVFGTIPEFLKFI